MSNHLISLAYTRNLRTSVRKAVLVLMADKASDDGSGIWAAKQTMADELCCSKQTVIDTIKGFIADGLVTECGQRKSPNGYTVEYHINITALEAVDLVKCHAVKGSRTLTGQAAGPVKEVDLTSQAAGPEPSLTPQGLEANASNPIAWARPAGVDVQVWKDLMANRKRKNKLNTPTAWKRFCDDLARVSALTGIPPPELIEHAAAEGWAGIYDPNARDHSNDRTQSPGIGRNEAAARATIDFFEQSGHH